MNEFSPRIGSAGKGALHALFAAVKFIIIPLFLTIMALSLLDASDSSTAATFASLLREYQPLLLIVGIVLTVLSFFKWFYPLGSYSRLAFDLALVPFLLFLLWGLSMGGRTSAAFSSAGVPVSVNLVLWLITLYIAFKSLYKLGEFKDNRRPFLIYLASKYPGERMPAPLPVEDPAQHRPWHDFRLRYGRYAQGMKEADKALVKYVVLPLIFIIILGAVLVKTQGVFGSMTEGTGTDISGLFNFGSATLERLGTLLLYIGMPIAVLSFFKGFYPKGSISRMASAMAIVVLLCIWLYMVMLGGHLNIAIDSSDINIHLNLNYVSLMWLFIIATALWSVYWLVEMAIYRRDWKLAGFNPVNEEEAKARRKRERELRKQHKAETRRVRKGQRENN